MKIRHGFVSNSSSASYTLVICDIDFNEFLDKMREEYFELQPYFALEDARGRLRELKELKKEHKKRFKKSKNDDDDAIQKVLDLQYEDMKEHIKSQKLRVERYEEIHKNEMDNEDSLRAIAKDILLDRVDISYLKQSNNIVVEGFSIMHNSLYDMPEYIKKAILLFGMSGKHIEWKYKQNQ